MAGEVICAGRASVKPACYHFCAIRLIIVNSRRMWLGTHILTLVNPRAVLTTNSSYYPKSEMLSRNLLNFQKYQICKNYPVPRRNLLADLNRKHDREKLSLVVENDVIIVSWIQLHN